MSPELCYFDEEEQEQQEIERILVEGEESVVDPQENPSMDHGTHLQYSTS